MFPNHLIWAVATIPLNGWADSNQVPLIICCIKHILDIFKDIPIFFFAQTQCFFRLFAFGNVAINTQQEFAVAKSDQRSRVFNREEMTIFMAMGGFDSIYYAFMAQAFKAGREFVC